MDAYSFCPCASGKKVKFCCGVEVIPEIEKIDRMLAGEQRRAALDHISKLPVKLREKPAIMVSKIVAAMGNDGEAAVEADRELLARHPENPIALARAAVRESKEGKIEQAVATMQDALDGRPFADDRPPPALIVISLMEIGRSLLDQNAVYAAREHLRLGSEQIDDVPFSDIIAAINHQPGLSLGLKDDPTLPRAPAAAPYLAEYEAITALAEEGRWRQSARRLRELIGRHPKAAPLYRALGAVTAYLADQQASIAALTAYADLVSIEEAIPAELAILTAIRAMTEPQEADIIEVVEVPAAIADFDQTFARLLSDRRIVQAKVDLASLAEEGQPAPRGWFALLDRPSPQVSESLKPEDIACTLGVAMIFGKETDRAARLEIECRRSDLEAALELLREVTGEPLAELGPEKVVRKISRNDDALSHLWLRPEGISNEQYETLGDVEHRRRMLEIWPDLKWTGLEGKTGREAAADPRLRRRLQALILEMETCAPLGENFDYGELRAAIGLPAVGDLDPFRVNLEDIPLVNLSRLPAELLPDEQLLMAFNLACSVRADLAAGRLGDALLARETVAAEAKFVAARNLAKIAATLPLKRRYVEHAKTIAAGDRRRMGFALIDQLGVALLASRSDREERRRVGALLDEVLQYHAVPGVGDQLLALLSAFGIDVAGMMQQSAAPLKEMSVAGISLKADAPESPAPLYARTPAEEPKKSALWLPGMD